MRYSTFVIVAISLGAVQAVVLPGGVHDGSAPALSQVSAAASLLLKRSPAPSPMNFFKSKGKKSKGQSSRTAEVESTQQEETEQVGGGSTELNPVEQHWQGGYEGGYPGGGYTADYPYSSQDVGHHESQGGASYDVGYGAEHPGYPHQLEDWQGIPPQPGYIQTPGLSPELSEQMSSRQVEFDANLSSLREDMEIIKREIIEMANVDVPWDEDYLPNSLPNAHFHAPSYPDNTRLSRKPNEDDVAFLTRQFRAVQEPVFGRTFFDEGTETIAAEYRKLRTAIRKRLMQNRSLSQDRYNQRDLARAAECVSRIAARFPLISSQWTVINSVRDHERLALQMSGLQLPTGGVRK